MKLVIGSDHAGFELKNAMGDVLRGLGHAVLDVGAFNTNPSDYPDFAEAVGRAVLDGRAERGLLICGSGVGASVAANKVRGIRAVMATDETIARYSRQHNGANVLTLGSSLLQIDAALRIIDVWLSTPMTEARYIRRLLKVRRLEEDF